MEADPTRTISGMFRLVNTQAPPNRRAAIPGAGNNPIFRFPVGSIYRAKKSCRICAGGLRRGPHRPWGAYPHPSPRGHDGSRWLVRRTMSHAVLQQSCGAAAEFHIRRMVYAGNAVGRIYRVRRSRFRDRAAVDLFADGIAFHGTSLYKRNCRNGGNGAAHTMESIMLHVSIARTHTVDVDESRFTDAVREYIFNYGLKQILNDAGSSGENPDEKLEMANKKLAAMYDGTVRTSGAREGDPVKAEANRLAADMVKAAIRRKGKKLSDYEPKAIRAAADTLLAGDRGDAIRAQAQANVAARAELVGDVADIDI